MLEAPTAREPSSRRSAPSRSSPSAALLAPADDGSARTTTSDPAGRVANRDRMRWRNRRCTRCRTTAPPTVRPTTNPTLGPSVALTAGLTGAGVSVAPTRARCTTTEPRAARRPRCTPVAKSSRRVSRAAAGSNARYPAREGLGRQLDATLAAPGRQDRAPGAGTHAQPEPVGPRAATVVRLERTLALAHGCRSPGAVVRVAMGEGAQECPPVGGRRPEPRRPGP
ncbi:MAG: hypothetical protein QOH09_881 [Pseudonocardiales bacterium]|nr:hypothetical protein [Pseudonocardiales bacterium]